MPSARISGSQLATGPGTTIDHGVPPTLVEFKQHLGYGAHTAALAVTTISLLLTGCVDQANRDGAADRSVLRLAATTSTRDSGLLDLLVPIFERQNQVRVDVVAVGSGAAFELGEAGDVDVLLVHARAAEDAFTNAGHGDRREDLMYNTFEILGPPDDPAQIRHMEPLLALQQIAECQRRFVSRGDNSGTHQRELELWRRGGGRPDWDLYFETGQGMAATLNIANQMNAYVLSDRGTYLKLKRTTQLVPLVVSTEELRNPYGIIVVNAKKNPSINGVVAHKFVDFMISAESQRLIGNYKILGEQAFFPLQLPPQN